MTITDLKIWLVERDGRRSTFFEAPEWAIEDEEYNVTVMVPDNQVQAIAQPSSDDTQERMQLMEELFTLQDTEIQLLKDRLESFVEVVESIVEITDVISHSAIENRSKLLLIGDSCKHILKSSE
jgi:D-mannonate dehydratase